MFLKVNFMFLIYYEVFIIIGSYEFVFRSCWSILYNEYM